MKKPLLLTSALMVIGLLLILGGCSDHGLGPPEEVPEEVGPPVTGFEERSGVGLSLIHI